MNRVVLVTVVSRRVRIAPAMRVFVDHRPTASSPLCRRRVSATRLRTSRMHHEMSRPDNGPRGASERPGFESTVHGHSLYNLGLFPGTARGQVLPVQSAAGSTDRAARRAPATCARCALPGSLPSGLTASVTTIGACQEFREFDDGQFPGGRQRVRPRVSSDSRSHPRRHSSDRNDVPARCARSAGPNRHITRGCRRRGP